MRHDWVDLSEHLHKGLRVSPEQGRRDNWLAECYNFMVSEGGLKSYEAISQPFSQFDPEWPFPQIFWNSKIHILAYEDHIFTFTDENPDPQLVLDLESPSGPWEILDFYDYLVLTNGSEMFYRDPEDGEFKELETSDKIPLFKTCCAFRGQAFVGNIPSWSRVPNSDECFIAWSNIGEFNFEPSKRNEANFFRAPWQGRVERLAPLGDAIVAYGDNGIIALAPMPESPHVGTKPLPGSGLLQELAVAGDQHLHIFLDKEKYLWKIGRDMMPKKIGYEEYIDKLVSEKIVISFDTLYRRFYISDGERCFLLTSHGMSEVFQCPTTVFSGQGFVAKENETFSRLRTSRNVMQYPGMKLTTAVAIGSSEVSSFQGLVMNEKGTEIKVRGNPEGVAYPRLAGTRLGVGAEFEDYTSSQLSALMCSVAFQGKEAVRGRV